MLSANQISVFFDRQYLVNGLTSDPDFFHVDTHEWTGQGLLIFRGKQGWKWCVLIALDLLQGFFFEILHNERGQEVYGYYINGFSEKNSDL